MQNRDLILYFSKNVDLLVCFRSYSDPTVKELVLDKKG